MGGHRQLSLILYVIANLCHVAPSEVKEGRKVGLLIPEKIIGGVIDIVHNHKNKPGSQGSYQQQSQTQQMYQPAPGYQPQYPSYQPQYPQSQNQGNYQSQYQNQYQNVYGYQPQNGNYASGYPQAGPAQNPAPVYQNTIQQPSYVNQGQSQGQYQNVYPPNQINQQQQTSGQYQSSQFQGGQYQNGHNQQTGQYQGGQSQQSNVQGQNQGGNYQGGMNQPNNQYQMQGQGSSSTQSGGFQVSGGSQSGGPGPTCVCQAWTKPDPLGMQDAPQKAQEKSQSNETSFPISE